MISAAEDDPEQYAELLINDFQIELDRENAEQIECAIDLLPVNHHIFFRTNEGYFIINKVNKQYQFNKPHQDYKYYSIFLLWVDNSRSKMRSIQHAFEPLLMCRRLYYSFNYALDDLLAKYLALLLPAQSSPKLEQLYVQTRQQQLCLQVFWQTLAGITQDEVELFKAASIPNQHYQERLVELLEFLLLAEREQFSYSDLEDAGWVLESSIPSYQRTGRRFYLGNTLFNQVLTGNYMAIARSRDQHAYHGLNEGVFHQLAISSA